MEDIQEEESGGTDEEVLGSSLTMEKVAAAKQYIENHYRAQTKNIQERKERYQSSPFSVLIFIFSFSLQRDLGFGLSFFNFDFGDIV